MPKNDAAITNVPEFSVSELAFSLKRTLEENFGHVRVRGEIGRVTKAGSGHLYTNLKDDGASIDAVCWKGNLGKLSITPEEGLEVICTGKISSYPASSKYQLIIETMELAGQGALLKMLEERKKKLAAEGLFAPERKRKLPFLPGVIGVITSPTGAVIRDILHRLEDRFPRHVLLWPVLVQGEHAAAQVTAALEGFQDLSPHGLPTPDLLIVARGGGSLEDLMPFNEESVVRAIAASAIPVISAIGHETDTTLADYAADLRAPTPTGAAEMAVPVRTELLAQILEDGQRLASGALRLLGEGRHKLEAQSAKLHDPARLIAEKTQRLDHLETKMAGSYARFLSVKEQRLIKAGASLRRPQDRLNDASKSLARWQERLQDLSPILLRTPQTRIVHLAKMLEAYSFKNVLQRGFAVVRDEQGHILSAAAQTAGLAHIDIQFHDDHIAATLGSTPGAAPRKKPAPKPAKKDNKNQGSLF